MPDPRAPTKAEAERKAAPAGKQRLPAGSPGGPVAASLEMQAALADPRLARPETVLRLQRAAGNRAVTGLVQRSRGAGAAQDAAEQEAGQAAESAGVQITAQGGAGPVIQRMEIWDEPNRLGKVRKYAGFLAGEPKPGDPGFAADDANDYALVNGYAGVKKDSGFAAVYTVTAKRRTIPAGYLMVGDRLMTPYDYLQSSAPPKRNIGYWIITLGAEADVAARNTCMNAIYDVITTAGPNPRQELREKTIAVDEKRKKLRDLLKAGHTPLKEKMAEIFGKAPGSTARPETGDVLLLNSAAPSLTPGVRKQRSIGTSVLAFRADDRSPAVLRLTGRTAAPAASASTAAAAPASAAAAAQPAAAAAVLPPESGLHPKVGPDRAYMESQGLLEDWNPLNPDHKGELDSNWMDPNAPAANKVADPYGPMFYRHGQRDNDLFTVVSIAKDWPAAIQFPLIHNATNIQPDRPEPKGNPNRKFESTTYLYIVLVKEGFNTEMTQIDRPFPEIAVNKIEGMDVMGFFQIDRYYLGRAEEEKWKFNYYVTQFSLLPGAASAAASTPDAIEKVMSIVDQVPLVGHYENGDWQTIVPGRTREAAPAAPAAAPAGPPPSH